MSNGDGHSYTAALQQVLHQLGRLDGKLDAYDVRIRALEEQQAAWRELLRVGTQDSDAWKARIVKVEEAVDSLENQRTVGQTIRHYWYVALLLALPILLNAIDTLQRLWP